jgi:hypothetical protein
MLNARHLFIVSTVLSLFLGACTRLEAPPNGLSPAAAAQMPLPSFAFTYSNSSSTRGFWFQAPVDFRITGLRVPDETGHGLQNVEVYKLASQPPEYGESASGGQVFYKTGVPSGEIIATDLSFSAGDYVGILGAAGDASVMHNSYGNGPFSSDVLGHPVVLERFLTQSNIVSTGGNQAYSSEQGGSIARVEVFVDESLPPATLATYTVDLETAPLNRILWDVRVGRGVSYEGDGPPNPSIIRVDGQRYLGGKVKGSNQVKVLDLYGSKRLTLVRQGTNTPFPNGGVIDIKPHAGFAHRLTLKSLTVSNITAPGAQLTLRGGGKFIKRLPLAQTGAGQSVTIALNEPGVSFVQVGARSAFAVDDVVFEDAGVTTRPR